MKPNLEDDWAKVELWRWQYGSLPRPDDFRPLDVSKGLVRMASALEPTVGEPDMPTPSNVAAVLRFAARLLSSQQETK